MIKIKEIYKEEKCGITFTVDYQNNKKRVTITPNGRNANNGFVFIDSEVNTVGKVGVALNEIAEFANNL